MRLVYSSGETSWFFAFEICSWIPRGREPLRVALQLLEALLHEPDLVGLVVDREVGAVPEPLRLPAQDPAAGGVEREHPETARVSAEEMLEPLLHLAGGLVRERDREELVRLRTDRVDQVGDAIRQDARLPGARAGDHEQRPFRGEDGLALGGVQVGEIAVRRRDGHAPDASDRTYVCSAPRDALGRESRLAACGAAFSDVALKPGSDPMCRKSVTFRSQVAGPDRVAAR